MNPNTNRVWQVIAILTLPALLTLADDRFLSSDLLADRVVWPSLTNYEVRVYATYFSEEELEAFRKEHDQDRQEVLARADAGDTGAQTRLAEDLLDDSHTGLFDRDEAEAYRWALIASTFGDREADYLLGEMNLFMSQENREKGTTLADAYMAESVAQPDAAPEPPPAAAVQESSETMNPKPKSEAPADSGGR